MDWVERLYRPDWATAIASALFAAISAGMTGWIAWARMRRTSRLEDRTEAILRDKRFKRRKFETIKAFVPLSDEKLREALLRAGAVQLVEAGGASGGEY